MDAVNYQQLPYAAAYPNLMYYFDDSPGVPKRNFIYNNVFLNVKMIHNGKPQWSYIGKTYISCEDPGFEDAANLNFELKPNSEIFR